MHKKSSTKLMGLVLLILFSLSIPSSLILVSGQKNPVGESMSTNGIALNTYEGYENKPAPPLPELIGPQPQWDFLLNQKVEPVRPWPSDSNLVVNIDTDRRTYTPGDFINFVISVTSEFRAVPEAKLNVSLFEGDTWWWYAPIYYDFELPSILQSMILTTDEEGRATGSFKVFKEGSYSIHAVVTGGNLIQEIFSTGYSYAQAYKTIQVSDLATFWRVPYIWTLDEVITSYIVVRETADFSKPVTDASISITLFTGGRWEEEPQTETLVYTGSTNEAGLVVAKFSVPERIVTDEYYSSYGYATLTVKKDNKSTQTTQWISLLPSSSSWDMYYGASSWHGKYEFVVTTDKSVYQPGQSIQTRVLVFENSYYNASRQVASTLPVTVDFIDPEGFHVSHSQSTTDDDGILTINFSLDRDAVPGNYLIIYSAGGSEKTIEIPVRFYQRPAFRVSIEAGRYHQPGQTIIGNITAEYYFGQPVQGTYEIHLYQLSEEIYIKEESVSAIPTPTVPSIGESETQISEENYKGKELATVTGELDKDGIGRFSIQIPKSLEPYPGMELLLDGSVTDVVDRKVSTSQTISVSPEIFVWAYADPFNVELGEEILIHFFVSDGWWWQRSTPEDSSVAYSDIRIQIYSTRDGNLGKQVFSASTTTDQFGQGELTIKLPDDIAAEYKTFIAVVKATTKDGRVGEGQTSFQYSVLDFEFSVTPKQINPGDEVTVTLTLTNKLTGYPERAEIFVSAYDSDYERINEAQFTLDGMKSLTIHLSQYAPEGMYQLYAWVTNRYELYRYGLYSEYGWAEATFQVGQISELRITPDNTTYKVGEVASINIETVSPSPKEILPIYLEISKRGLIFITVLDSSSFTLDLPLTYSYTPKLFLNVFAIGASGTFLTATSEIQIDFDLTVNISTNKETYEPGDQATITITVEDGSGTRIPALTSMVLVDSSVYGVIPDPEREMDAFIEKDFYSSLTTRISWFSPQVLYPYLGIPYYGFPEDGGVLRAEEQVAITTPLATPAPGMAFSEVKSQEFPEVQESEIRKELPESALWRPKLAIGSNGELSLELKLPDNIGEWTIRTVTNVQGHGSLDKITITTFKDFFIELKHPLFAYQDDTFEVQGLLYNYGNDASVQASLRFEGEGLAYLVNAPTQIVPVFTNEITIVRWYVFASEPGKIYTIATAATNDERTDGLQKPLTIKPNAVLFEDRFAGVVNETHLTYYLYAQSIQHTARLTIVPGFTGAALEGWRRLIGYPYGCTEQTMSRLLPSALVYKYLQETGQLDSDTQTLIEDMIFAGITRLYAFHHPDGGWGWWEKDESNVHMTAIVLFGFGILKELRFSIDLQMINSAIDYLFRQQREGHWSMEGRGWNIGSLELTACIIRSILIAEPSFASDSHIKDALIYLENEWASSRNPYLGALLGQAILRTGMHQTLFEQIINYLASSYNVEKGNMIYWGETEWWHWYSLGGPVETTAIVIQLFLDAERTEYYLLVNRAANWLMSRQNHYGWGTTADTSAAILAITTLAKLGGDDIESTVRVTENEQLIHEFYFTSASQAERVKLNPQVGLNTVELEQDGIGIIFYHLEISCYVRTELQLEGPSTLDVTVNHPFPLIIDLQFDETSPILPVDIVVQLEEWDESLELVSDPKIHLEQLTSSTSVIFNFSPKETGTFVVNRIRLQYNLASRDELSNRAPATLSQIHGPISIRVQKQSSTPTQTQQERFSSSQFNQPKLQSGTHKSTDKDRITIARTYSKSTGIKIGETIFVSILITNEFDQTMSYLVVEEPLLPWFTLDEYSLQFSEYSWSVTSDQLTFFIPSLESGQDTKIEYGIIAIGNVDISAAATVVSSMYSALVYQGTPNRLITGDIPQVTFEDGIPSLDTSPPIISDVQISNTRPKVSERVKISANVVDDQAVQEVLIWYKSEHEISWNKQLMALSSSVEFLYETEIKFKNEGSIFFLIQAEDWVQNSNLTEKYRLIVEGSKRISKLLAFIGLGGSFALLALGVIFYKVFYKRSANAVSKGDKFLLKYIKSKLRLKIS
ncbi:MAG: MG2 domain-containing protein [Candidatus Hodarchaeota archaeon]